MYERERVRVCVWERARFYEGEERSTLNREKGCPKGQIGKERKKEKKENKEIF